jgi:hypothetical protein
MWLRLASGDVICGWDRPKNVTQRTNRIHIPRASRLSAVRLREEHFNRRLLMGSVVISCPATGRTIPTGIEADRLKFSCSPVFFADAYCPHCNASHRWFARDAWVEEARVNSIAEAA